MDTEFHSELPTSRYAEPGKQLLEYMATAGCGASELAETLDVPYETMLAWLRGEAQIPYRYFARLQHHLRLTHDEVEPLIFAYHPKLQAFDSEWLIQQPAYEQEGTLLYALRIHKQINRQQLAEILKVKVKQVEDWEHHEESIPKELIAPLADIFECTSEQRLNLHHANHNAALYFAFGGTRPEKEKKETRVKPALKSVSKPSYWDRLTEEAPEPQPKEEYEADWHLKDPFAKEPDVTANKSQPPATTVETPGAIVIKPIFPQSVTREKRKYVKNQKSFFQKRNRDALPEYSCLIIKYLEERNVSQAELGRAVGDNNASLVATWIAGRQHVSVAKWMKLVDFFELTEEQCLEFAMANFEEMKAYDPVWLEAQPKEKRAGLMLKAYRIMAGKTLAEVASDLQLTQKGISRWETGLTIPVYHVYDPTRPCDIQRSLELTNAQVSKLYELMLPCINKSTSRTWIEKYQASQVTDVSLNRSA